MTCPICGGVADEVAVVYDAPPEHETTFDLGGQTYHREYVRCAVCGHLAARHDLDLTALYEGGYMDATYAGDRLRTTYERIMALPPEQSDNVQRVARVVKWLGRSGTVLDVGSGLGVFPARIRDAGWTVTALDPDDRAVAHAREVVGVDAVRADFMTADGFGRFDLVTLNKVLEHVEDPIAMLRRASAVLAPGGTVYVEVPDGETAAAEGPHREELFIEHLHVFSLASTCLAAQHAELRVMRAERLREPSGKLTVVALLEAA